LAAFGTGFQFNPAQELNITFGLLFAPSDVTELNTIGPNHFSTFSGFLRSKKTSAIIVIKLKALNITICGGILSKIDAMLR
ncbi:MAG: hypothetical protein IJ938_03240, partial [Clostridia bacterium]|nr:hypothetical protein [Clostridia bacterium]